MVKISPIFAILSAFSALAQTPAPKPAAAPPVTLQVVPPNGAAPVTDPNKVIASFGTEKITAGQFEDLIKGLPAQYQQQARGPGKRQFMDQVIQMKLLAKEAQARKLDQKPEVQQQLAFTRDNILANAAFTNMMETVPVDEGALRAYYTEHKSDYEMVTARHILIRFKDSPVPVKEGQKDLSEDEALAKAKELLAKLKAGGDFAEMAKAESADTGSGANGGELGSFKRGQMVKPFEDMAFSLKAGQISDPVKSQFGYHIIQTEKQESKSFDEVKGEIEKRMKPDMAKKQMDDMKTKADPKLDDAFFGPAPAPMPAPGAAPAAK